MGSPQHILELRVGDACLLLVLPILGHHAAEDEVLVVPTRLGLETATHLVRLVLLRVAPDRLHGRQHASTGRRGRGSARGTAGLALVDARHAHVADVEVEMRDIPGDAGRDVAQVAETVAEVVGAGFGDGAEGFPLNGRGIPAGAIPAASRCPLVVCRVLLLRLGGSGKMHAGCGNWMCVGVGKGVMQ